MTLANKTFNTTSAAQTSAGPTSIVAMEQTFPAEQRIIHDELALKILPKGYQWVIKLLRIPFLRDWLVNMTEKRLAGVWSGMVCRKRYIDEKIVSAVENSSVAAIVNLGAGYDTRVYRLRELAAIPVWEVDQPVNIAAKQKGLHNALGTIPSHVTLVPINFITQDLGAVLNQYGYDGDVRTFFIWEAVTQYLTETAVRQTLNFLAQSPIGSQLTFTYVPKDFINGTNFYDAEKFYQRAVVKEKMWHFGFDPLELADFLFEYGWRLRADLSYSELNDRYVKPTGRNLASMAIERIVYAGKI